jgi:alpha-1,6-mannosyltransferase
LDQDIDVMDPAPSASLSTQPKSPGRARLVRFAGPSLPYDATYHLLWRVDKIRELVAREKPDVLGIQSPYVAAAAALSVPRENFGARVFTWHSDFIDTYLRVMLERRMSPRLASRALEPLWAMVRTIARGCDATFVASRWQAEKLRAHDVQRVVELPFGIERRTFVPGRRSEALRRELLGPGRERHALLLGVGRLAVEKRWDVVFDAFFKVRQSREAVLVVFGDGPERARLEERAKGRGDVVIRGFERDRDRLAAALASADALVHGCPYETFGLSIAEALACGLPCVVPDEGGAAEMIDSASGEAYASLDADACARAVLDLLARDRTELREGALATSERIPDVVEQFARTFEAYRALLPSPR